MDTLYFLTGILFLVLVTLFGIRRIDTRTPRHRLPADDNAGMPAERRVEHVYVERFLRESA